MVRRDIRPRPGLRANPPALAPAPSGPTLLLPVFSSCPHARRGGPGRRWLWRRGAAGRHPGRVQWAAGQCRATQRQHGYELDIAQRAHAAIGAPLPALRVVITQIAGTSSPVVSQATGDKYAQAATSAVTASQLTGSLRRLPRPLDRVLGDSRTLHMPIGGEKPSQGRERQAGRSGHPSSGLARPAVRTRRHGPPRGRSPTPKQ